MSFYKQLSGDKKLAFVLMTFTLMTIASKKTSKKTNKDSNMALKRVLYI